MDAVTLRNGAVEVKPLVAAIMMKIGHLLEDRPLALYDLVMRCRDPDYPFFGDNEQYLQELELVGTDGSIYSSDRNVILSAVDGDNIMNMVVRSPVAQP